MRNQYQCQTCKGVYFDTNTDGSIYTHTCPPLTDPVTGQPADAVNKRNENVQLDRKGRAVGIVATGAGVAPITAGAPAQPAWITSLQNAAAAANS